MKFRPCIDIHNGKVKQIVGGSLKDQGNQANENFVSEQDASYYAQLYKEKGITGGHVILLNKKDSEYYPETKRQALLALSTYPGGLQVGGQAADKALNEILAPLHSLPGQGFYPADRAGDALLHGLRHRRRHAFDAAGQPLQDVLPEVEPVEGGDHRDDSLHDLAHILDDERDAVDKAFAQLHHEADRTG